jgi:hypothetical protein
VGVGGNVLKKVPHRHFVFSIPKILRIYFLFNRSLLKELSKISWEIIKDYYENTCKRYMNLVKKDRLPG